MDPSVSVVIPNFNGRKLLEENLPSVVAALRHSGCAHEIIVADDASADDSVGFLQKAYPGVQVVVSDSNGGFAKNVNRGISRAKMDLVLILNSDVKLREGYFEPQLRYFQKQDTFGVMGGIYDADGKLIDSAKYPAWKGPRLRSTVNFTLEDAPADTWCTTLFLSGANALVDRKKLIALGGFDEIYSPFYMEDVDLSVRAWRKGWACYYEPQARCTHVLSSTISALGRDHVKRIAKRNRHIFHYLHLSGFRRFLWKTQQTGGLLLRWLALDAAYYRSYMDYRKAVRNRKPLKERFSLAEVTARVLEPVKAYGKRLF
ncbi:MAG: glycosyltransferase family 2 protein [Bacteroidota bacterium]